MPAPHHTFWGASPAKAINMSILSAPATFLDGIATLSRHISYLGEVSILLFHFRRVQRSSLRGVSYGTRPTVEVASKYGLHGAMLREILPRGQPHSVKLSRGLQRRLQILGYTRTLLSSINLLEEFSPTYFISMYRDQRKRTYIHIYIVVVVGVVVFFILNRPFYPASSVQCPS